MSLLPGGLLLAMLVTLGLAWGESPTTLIDWVDVGEAGNPPSQLGLGAVTYGYRIGKHEVTLGEYTEFLNAAARSDPHGLYNSLMASSHPRFVVSGIVRSGSSGSYSYSVLGTPGRPVTWVNWFNAARFANWLHNGQPADGSGTEFGAYNLGGAVSGYFQREATARYWLPSEDEWYKAAFYDPAKAGNPYWRFPTRSNEWPSNDLADVGNNANFYQNGYTLALTPGKLTEVGYFEKSSSYYGTFDQGGNVWEWVESPESGTIRVMGGSWDSLATYMQSTLRASATSSTYISSDRGFRVASLSAPPEITAVYIDPSTLWPPNGKMVKVGVAAEVEGGTGDLELEILGIECNEPDSPSDYQILDGQSVALRATRQSKGNGRVYTIYFRVVDEVDSASETATATVFVPHDQREGPSKINGKN